MTEWNAEAYHDRAALQQWVAEDSLAYLDLQEAQSVLDLGCGDGRITAEIAQRIPQGRVLGVDPSSQMVTFARQTYGSANNLTFEVADARTLSYKTEFDLVVSFNALHWAVPVASTLTPIRNALRHGGRALLQFVGLGERKSLETVIEEVRSQSAWSAFFEDFQPPFQHLAPEEFRSYCEGNGLTVESIELNPREWDFGDTAAFHAWSQATMTDWTSRLPAERRDAFISDVLTAYGSHVFSFYQMVSRLHRPLLQAEV